VSLVGGPPCKSLLGLAASMRPIVWFPAAPLWAFLMIILDVVIIYQLTARWQA
jgi:hypothetical protein